MIGILTLLRKLDACEDAVAFVSSQRTARDAWETCVNGRWMMWLVGRACSRGTISRRRLVQVVLECVAPIVHLLPETSIDDLGIVAQWTVGAGTIDEVRAARRRLWQRRPAVTTAAIVTTADVYAFAVAAGYAYAYADAAIYDVGYDAGYDADACCFDIGASAAADVIRSVITIDELCAALDVDPDAPICMEKVA